MYRKIVSSNWLDKREIGISIGISVHATELRWTIFYKYQIYISIFTIISTENWFHLPLKTSSPLDENHVGEEFETFKGILRQALFWSYLLLLQREQPSSSILWTARNLSGEKFFQRDSPVPSELLRNKFYPFSRHLSLSEIATNTGNTYSASRFVTVPGTARAFT